MNLSVPLAKDILPKLKQFRLHWINLKKKFVGKELQQHEKDSLYFSKITRKYGCVL